MEQSGAKVSSLHQNLYSTNATGQFETRSTKQSGDMSPSSLLKQKLKNSTLPLTSEQSIAVIGECLEAGKEVAKSVKDKEIIQVIGNTEVGKSTLINLLAGCQLVRKKASEIKGLKNPISDTVVVVKSVDEGGPLNEIMSIGHGMKSETFMLKAYQTGNKTFVDGPGPFDNRGAEINIANAVNIRLLLTQAASAKFIILLNHDSIAAERANGIMAMVKTCIELFGSKEKLESSMDSILVGVTKVPLATDEPRPLKKLKKLIAKANYSDAGVKHIAELFAEKIFIFDCEDKKLKYEGSSTVDEILKKIDELKFMKVTADTFKTALSSEDEKALNKICRDFKILIEDILNKSNPSEEELKKAAGYSSIFKNLSIIEHTKVNELITTIESAIVNHFNAKIHASVVEFSNINTEKLSALEKTIRKLKSEFTHFDSSIQSKIKISDLEVILVRYQATMIVESLRKKAGEFQLHCTKWELAQAKICLTEIVRAVANFELKFGTVGIKHDVLLENLKAIYKGEKARVKEKNEKEEIAKRLEEEKRKKIEKRQKEKRELMIVVGGISALGAAAYFYNKA